MSNLKDVNNKIENSVVKAYKTIEKEVVQTYKGIESSTVNNYKNIEDKFIYSFLKKDSESIEEAKIRIKKSKCRQKNLIYRRILLWENVKME